MFRKGELMYNIRWKLRVLTYHAKAENKLGMTNINHDAESFYGGLLSIVLDKQYPGLALTNLNALKMNFPAIDLADVERKVCVQVTTTEGREKIQSTLDKYFQHRLDEKYGFRRLIVLIIGERLQYRKSFELARPLEFDHETDVWDTEYLLAQIEEQDVDVVAKVDDYLRKHLDLPDKKAPSMDLPLVSAMTAEGFVGRGEELAKIAAEIKNGTMPIVISGLGGMGKTELAVRFCKDYRDRGQGNVYMVTFQDSFRKTLVQNVATAIPTLQGQKLNEQELYERVLHQLKQLDKTDILLIDNADGDGSAFSKLEDDAYRELQKLPMHLIITTRCHVPGAVKADALKEEYLRSLFDLYGVNIPVEERDRLIHAVNSHTMTVDLMARTMLESFVDTEQMIHAMQTGDMDEILDSVGTYHNQDPAQRRIDGHLLALFQVAKVDEAARRLLSCAILLPQGGMNYDLFMKALPEGTSGAMNGLVKRGWLSRDHGTRLLTIHPVLRLVCRGALENWKEICPEFLTRLHEKFEEKDFKQGIYGQLAQVYLAAAEAVPEDTAMWHFRAGWYLLKNGQYDEALECELHTLKVRENTLAADDLLIADSCNDLGIVYGYLGQYENALGAYQRAYDIRREKLRDKHRKTAHSCNNVGEAYHDLGNYDQALVNKQNAMAIFENILQPDDLDLSRSYNNVGTTYSKLGDHKQALEYHQKAQAIREKVLPRSHPDLASSYDNVGAAYGGLGDHKQALEYHQKALEILEKVLPPEHPDLAFSYNNVGAAYGGLGDHKQALEFLIKALEIRKQALRKNHPGIAESLYNVSVMHYKQAMGMKAEYLRKKGLRTALGYAREALQVAQNCPSGTHRLMEDIIRLENKLKRLAK